MVISQWPDLLKFGFAMLCFIGLWLYVRSFDWIYEWICRRAQLEYERIAKAQQDALLMKRQIRAKRKADLEVRRKRQGK